jgi:hypothetical protein
MSRDAIAASDVCLEPAIVRQADGRRRFDHLRRRGSVGFMTFFRPGAVQSRVRAGNPGDAKVSGIGFWFYFDISFF